MQDYTDQAMNAAALLRASYADIRISELKTQRLSVKNGRVEALEEARSEGFGVRVLVNGAWGFASSHLVTMGEIDRVVAQAVQIAKASALVRHREEGVTLGEAVTTTGRYATPFERDPFEVPLSEKIDLLLEADQRMRAVAGIAISSGTMDFQSEHKFFANSSGSFIEQTLMESGAGIAAFAAAQGEFQRRSFPNSFGGQFVAGGYEFVTGMGLLDNAERIASEAVALLSAPRCPGGTFDLIIGGSQVALQVHESCGHPIELDRVFGTEAAYAGTSFLTPEKLYDFQYGSEAVNIVADATSPHGLGTFGFDDEGIPAQRTEIVSEGRFVGYLDEPRDGAGASRAEARRARALQRDDARQQLEPHPADPHDQHQPAAGKLEARRSDRRHRARALPGHEPLLVHRRPTAQLSVRHRGRLRDQGRQAGTALQECHLHRHHPRVLARLRRRLRRVRLDDLGLAELRQGATLAAGPCGPRGKRGALPQRARAREVAPASRAFAIS